MRRFALPALAAVALAATPAAASFPWVGAGDPGDPSTWHTVPGQNAQHTGAPSEVDCGTWKGAATPEPNVADCGNAGGEPAVTDQQNEAIRNDPQELGGVRGDAVTDTYATDPFSGAPVHTAFNVTTGRPDVTIAVLDSGIEWNNPGEINDLRNKVRLNTGELPKPEHADGSECAGYDCNGDGVVDVDDYASDPRVNLNDPRRMGPPGVLTPQDLLIAFSDGTDADHNGFVDDIAGWDFVDNDNDPFDDVQYDHGTGEAKDSTGEANNGGDVGTCPNCTVLPLRVGESFVADVNRFAQATLYATDNGVSIVQEALGTVNNSTLARNAIDYAYDHGVTVVASAADEAAQHHNQPGILPHTILVNSVSAYDQVFSPQPRSYLQFDGCSNFSAKLTVSVPSSRCSSEATGRSAGVVGLIYSAAKNAGEHITPNEVRQLFQGTADDVDFADSEVSCPAPHCTDPNLNAPSKRVELSPVVDTKPYPSRKGFDQFYGYGRLNAYAAVHDAATGRIPPEASIESPDWFTQMDPSKPTVDIRGRVAADRAPGYTCAVYVAPGVDPNNGSDVSSGGYGDSSALGDFHAVDGGFCDGKTVHDSATAANQLLGSISTAQLQSYYPPQTSALSNAFTGNENGGLAQTSNGRPNTEPYAFTVKVVVTATGAQPLRGEDRRELYLHKDSDLLPGWPRQMTTDGASSPLLVDLDGDNRNELVFGTSDGEVHALRRDGTELPGFPAHGDPMPLHLGEKAFADGDVPAPPGGAILGSVAAADLNHDGIPELIAGDIDGRLYAWNAKGQRVLTLHSEERFSGKPLQPFVNVRNGHADRIEHGFVASPVVADLDGDGSPEIIAASLDRHLYAWHADGTPVDGFPVLIEDPAMIGSVDTQTDNVTLKKGVTPENQGKLIDTPAVGDINGDGKPDIIVGSNEEYLAGEDGGFNGSYANTTSATAIVNATGNALLHPANGRVYAVKNTGNADGHPFLPGWPVKVGLLDAELLPDVGEGINGSPVLADVTCPSGGKGVKVGVTPGAGLAYIFNGDGTSCYGAPDGKDVALATDATAGAGQTDHPIFPAVGLPAWGDLGGPDPSFVAPAAGLLRAVDLIAPDYQAGSQDFTSAWDPATGQVRPGWPAEQNDLSFLTGPVIADIDGLPGQEVVAGTASLDLQAFNTAGAPASAAWPKLTGDWTVSTPEIGSFGTLDTDATAHKTVVSITRSGTVFAFDTAAPACSPASWPRFHHDNANSGFYTRDAILPGTPMDAKVDGAKVTFTAPGDDLMCGTVDHYEVRAEGKWAKVAGTPVAAGATQTIDLPDHATELRAVDDQGNVGRSIRVS